MKNIFYIVILIVLGSCTRQIPFDDPGSEQKLVLSGLIEPNDSIAVEVSASASILRPGDAVLVDDADISLYEDGIYLGDLEPDEFDVYRLDFAPEEGHIYELVGNHEDLGTVSSETTIPSALSVSNITVDDAINVNDEQIFRVAFDLDDPVGDNFYVLHIVENNYWGDNWSQSFFSTDPFFLGGSQDNYFWDGAAFRDDAFDGQKQRITIDLDYVGNNGILLISATKEHFLYHLSYKAYQNSNGDPFAQPVQIYSNVENGLGIFAGHNKTFTEIPY